MLSAMLFISPSAVRPAVSTATAIATKAVTSAITALTKLFQRLKDAVCAIFGGSVFVADADADAVASGTTAATADCEDTIITDDASDETFDDELEDESDEEDSAAAVTAAPIPVKSLYRVLWAMATNATSHPVVRETLQLIRDDLQKPLAADAVALQYFTAIRDEPKYAALSPCDKDAAIALVNHLHVKNDRRAFELDYDLALIDVVVGALRKCDYIVEKTYIVLLFAWWNSYLYLAWLLMASRRDDELPFPSTRRTSLTTYFDRYPSPKMASDHFLTVFPSTFRIV